MWKWLALPPPEVPEGTNRHYQNDEFEHIMKRYFEEMRERQKKMKSRIEQARADAKENVAGPVQDDAQQTEVDYTPTIVDTEPPKQLENNDESSSSVQVDVV